MGKSSSGLGGRVAIVTGGARGIGRSICLALADRGADIVVADIDFSGARQTAAAAELRLVQAVPLRVDVSNRASVKAMTEKTLDRFGRLDILVNNAGICPFNDLESIDDEEWRRVIDVNLTGPFLCSQEAIRPMVGQRWGRIVAISSVAGKIGGLKSGVHYAASKGGLIAMTLCIARQYARFGVTANVIAPGQIETDMISEWTPEAKCRFVDQIPVGRLGQPRDVAAAVAFLASEEASFITGEVIDVNGGFMMD